MLGKREGIILGEDKYVADSGIDTVAQCEVNNAVLTAKWNSRLGAILNQDA